jgi:hypothetical protein
MISIWLLITGACTPLTAQDPGTPKQAISLSVGMSQFDLAGTGSAPVLVARYDHALGGSEWLIGDASFTVLRPNEQLVQRRTYLIGEAQVQAQLPAAVVRPYLGGGLGWFQPLTGPSRGQLELSLSAAGGVRIIPANRIVARFELRVRGIGTGFEAAMADFTAGVGWQL